uniref:Uncharacterized protein n=1 Tax=Tanacetum cinerariifolium TaxID=118510 RepID=A0A6L2L2M9_TANCI|nr:hypothetical protein [Tanacetum cinerariifolium]
MCGFVAFVGALVLRKIINICLVSQTIGNDEGPNKLSLDHIFEGINLHVLVEKTKSDSKGLETVLTKPTIGKGASTIKKEIKEEFNTSPDLSNSDDIKKDIKLEDLSKLEKTKAKDKVAFLLAQPSYPNVAQLNDLMVKSLQPKISKLLSSHDFASSLPTELKELPYKFNELTGEVNELKKHVHNLEIKLPGELKEIPKKLETFTSTVNSLTTQVIESASKKVRDNGVPSAGQDRSHPAKGEKNNKHVTIS